MIVTAEASWRSLAVRWLKFNAVGLLGIFVQFAGLALFLKVLGMGTKAGTALAVEIAVLHNFVWHELYTWADRTRGAHRGAIIRLLRFNLTTGLVSIAGNVALMAVFVDWLHAPVMVAGGLAITACSLANFAVSHWFVFGKARH